MGQLTSHFGLRSDPFNGGKRFHHGIDLGAPYGAPIYSTQSGVVTYSGPYSGYGNVAVVYHGSDLYTLYGHTSRLYVKRGDTVRRGQLLAAVGSTGRSTGPHLHFEVHQNKKYIDPITYLNYLAKAGYAPLRHGNQQLTRPTRPAIETEIVYGKPPKPAAVGGGDSDEVVSTVAVDEPEKPLLPKLVNMGKYPKPQAGKNMQVISGTQVKTVRF